MALLALAQASAVPPTARGRLKRNSPYRRVALPVPMTAVALNSDAAFSPSGSSATRLTLPSLRTRPAPPSLALRLPVTRSTPFGQIRRLAPASATGMLNSTSTCCPAMVLPAAVPPPTSARTVGVGNEIGNGSVSAASAASGPWSRSSCGVTIVAGSVPLSSVTSASAASSIETRNGGGATSPRAARATLIRVVARFWSAARRNSPPVGVTEAAMRGCPVRWLSTSTSATRA